MLLKPMPLSRSHRVESDGMFGFSNRLCLRKISHSEVLVKRAKHMSGGAHRVPRGTPTGCHVAALSAFVGPIWTHGKVSI